MKDLFGNHKPVAIEIDEWWFNGRIIQKQNDSRLPKWISFSDVEDDYSIEIHASKRDAISYALKNPCLKPKYFGLDYIKVVFND